MKRHIIQSLSFAILLGLALAAPALFATAAPAAASGGTISGQVTISGRGAGETLVYIASVPGNFGPRGTPQIDQRGLRFHPHVLPIVVGTTVNFLNSDDVQHNIFTPSAAGDFFNLGTWPKGQTRPHTFTKLGKVALLCNVHHEMSAYILVLQNPFFAMTDGAGNYRINGVPAGNYSLKVWREHGSAPSQQISVSAGGVVTANFGLR